MPPIGESRDYIVATVTRTAKGPAAFCGTDITYWTGSRPGWRQQAGTGDFAANADDPLGSERLCRG